MSLRFCRGCTRSLFYSFQHRSFIHCGMWKTQGLRFQRGECGMAWRKAGEKRKEKASTFFWKKRKFSCISPQNPPWKMQGNTSRIKISLRACGKLGGKSGKHRGKLPLFFTNSVENTVEKVDKSIRQHQKWIQPAVLALPHGDS